MTALTVTPNPALDLTYRVDELVRGEMHRVRSALTRPGGKGVNVARTLRALGVATIATGIAGGPEGDTLRAGLAGDGITDGFVTDPGITTRRTVNVVDDAGTATLLNEPGPEIADHLWTDLCDRVRHLATSSSVVTVSGSLPPGIDPRHAADLISAARSGAVPVVADMSGPALDAALAAQPDVIKPNIDELRELTAETDPFHAAHGLHARSGSAVVASLGADGLLAVTRDGAWQARPPERISGNPTGAGDAVTATIAHGLITARPWPEILRTAAAVSAATVLAAVAGEYDLTAATRFLPAVDITEVPL